MAALQVIGSPQRMVCFDARTADSCHGNPYLHMRHDKSIGTFPQSTTKSIRRHENEIPKDEKKKFPIQSKKHKSNMYEVN